MGSVLPLGARKRILDGTLAPASHTIKAALLGSGYVPSSASEFASSFAGHELAGTGYVAGFGGSGRKTVTGKAVSVDAGLNVARWTCAVPQWAAINAGQARYVAFVREVTNDADSPILAVCDLGSEVVTDGGPVTITAPADGWIEWAVP